MRRDRGAEALEVIDAGLADYDAAPPIPIDEAWQEKLDSLRDFEALAWDAVARGRISAGDASDAIDDFIVYIEAADNPYIM